MVSSFNEGDDPPPVPTNEDKALLAEGGGPDNAQRGTASIVEPEPETNWSAVEGFILALILQLLQVLNVVIAPYLIAFVGVTQLVYIIPAILIARSKRRPKFAMGVAIGGAVVFLLNATCFGLILYNLRFGIR
ncbi:MAG: hypothetical protein ACREDR_39135 [Blastocatellia bacterium]